MNVHIVCYEDVNAWILGKYALCLARELTELGVSVDISKQSDRRADINHHIIYFNYDGSVSSTDTMMITHIDSEWKLERIGSQLRAAEMGVCCSRATMELLESCGLPRDRLCFINPAHDHIMQPAPLVLGITSKVQPSGCKREWLLVDVAKKIDPALFAFEIMGTGWEAIVERLRALGFRVVYHPGFDRDVYQRIVPAFDYYLYLGLDEGSMGWIDAMAAGVPTIVPPQGYHLDVLNGVTHPFVTSEDLIATLLGIQAERQARVQAVSGWTWRNYAKKHLLVWHYCLDRKQGQKLHTSFQKQLVQLGIGKAETAVQASASKVSPPGREETPSVLFVYPNYSQRRQDEEEGLAARLRDKGFRVEAYGIPCQGWLPFPDLDRLYRARDKFLCSAYDQIREKIRSFDALLANGGSMVHPEFVAEFKDKAMIFSCADDPESSDILSKPVAPSFDASLVYNAACLASYAAWGVADVRFIFQPIPGHLLGPEPDERMLLESRDIDLCFFGEGVYHLSDRHLRLLRVREAFPQMILKGKGWPGGFVSDQYMATVYSRAKIGLNMHNSIGPCNSRSTLLPAMGVLQVCDNKKYLGALFEIDKEIIGFDDVEEGIDKIRFFLAHDEERATIALAGCRKARQDYTEVKWMERIADTARDILSRKGKQQSHEHRRPQ